MALKMRDGFENGHGCQYFARFQVISKTANFHNKMSWFESPFPKSSSRQNHFIPDTTHDPEDHWGNVLSLHSPPDTLNFPSHPHPLSPWSRSLTDPPITLSLPSLPIQSNLPGSLNFSDEEEELITPMRQAAGKEQGDLHTTGRKSEGDLLLSARRSRPREKGLRKLSQRAFEIVQEMRNVTYKEVAAKLVQELNEDEGQSEVLSLPTQNKEQQNIKRRVYDALNVLIALGVLRKDGRKIVSNRLKEGRSNYHMKRIEILKQKVAIKEQSIKKKEEKLKEEVAKQEKITLLIKRNQLIDKHRVDKIYFPFIGVNWRTPIVEGNQGSIRLHKEIMEMRAHQALLPFGDMDTIKFFQDKKTEEPLPPSKIVASEKNESSRGQQRHQSNNVKQQFDAKQEQKNESQQEREEQRHSEDKQQF